MERNGFEPFTGVVLTKGRIWNGVPSKVSVGYCQTQSLQCLKCNDSEMVIYQRVIVLGKYVIDPMRAYHILTVRDDVLKRFLRTGV